MPSTSRTATLLRYGLIALVLVILTGLGWWYLFLRAQQDALSTSDAGRGAGLAPPSFGGILGSTYSNIVERFSEGGGEERVEGPLARLRRITQTPVAALGFIPRGEGPPAVLNPAALSATSSLLRFVERGTGYVVDAELEMSTVTRRTNTLVPQVYEGIVAVSGGVFLRSIDEAGATITNIGVVTEAKSSGDTTATSTSLLLKALPKNIRSVAVSPSGEEVLYVLEESGGASVFRAASDGGGPRRIAELGVLGWQIVWLADGRVILVQNREDGLVGYAYELRDNGSLASVANPALGLSLLPKSASSGAAQGAMLYSSGFTLSARAGSDSSIVSVPLQTISDKCVWAPGSDPIAYCAVPRTSLGAGALGGWLRGEVHSSDTWWKVDVRSGRTDILYEPGDVRLDVQNPMINPDGTYIAFLNGEDKSLWLLRISE